MGLADPAVDHQVVDIRAVAGVKAVVTKVAAVVTKVVAVATKVVAVVIKVVVKIFDGPLALFLTTSAHHQQMVLVEREMMEKSVVFVNLKRLKNNTTKGLLGKIDRWSGAIVGPLGTVGVTTTKAMTKIHPLMTRTMLGWTC